MADYSAVIGCVCVDWAVTCGGSVGGPIMSVVSVPIDWPKVGVNHPGALDTKVSVVISYKPEWSHDALSAGLLNEVSH